MNGRSSFVIKDAPDGHQTNKDSRSSAFTNYVRQLDRALCLRNQHALKQQRDNSNQDRRSAIYPINDLVNLLHLRLQERSSRIQWAKPMPDLSVTKPASNLSSHIAGANGPRLNHPGMHSAQPKIFADRRIDELHGFHAKAGHEFSTAEVRRCGDFDDG